jgi:excisionase family DNA binding protein
MAEFEFMNPSRHERSLFWTVHELAAYLHIKPSTLYAWAAQDKIPCVKIHGLVRFRRETIEQWLASFEPRASLGPPRLLRRAPERELDPLIAAVKRAVYTSRRGKTRPTSRPITKEEMDGAV